MSDLFNENMTYPQAQRVFFDSVIGKTESEKARIKAEYRSVLPKITKKELSTHPNRMTSHPLCTDAITAIGLRRGGTGMIHHYITKYEENGKRYAEAWIQIDLLRWCFCVWKRKIEI